MTDSLSADAGALRTRLRSVTLLQGPNAEEGVQLSSVCESLVGELQPFRGCRVALTSQRAEHVLAALAAAEAVECELLLSRLEAIPRDMLELWGVSAVVDASLAVKATAAVQRPERWGFAVLISTSGTTGEPKLAVHTIDGLLGRIREGAAIDSQKRWLLTYHPGTFGGLQVLLTVLMTGSSLVTAFPQTIAALAEASLVHRPTHISATPTFWRSFLNYLGPRASELRLRQVTLGGEIADEAILTRLKATFGEAKVSHIYASTEAGALFSVQDGRPGFPATWLETGVDDVSLRICDGSLHVRSPRTMKRYANRDNRSVMSDDGWLITGDLVERVGDRILFLGREDSLLNVGGAKVRPEEVEARLLAIPGVADARVYGIPNPLTGMVVGADIVLEPGLTKADARGLIVAKLRDELENHKIPRILRFPDAIEASAAGKKQRRT